MCEDGDKIILPKEIQKEMIEFFLKTSIPRKKKEQEEQRVLSEKQKQTTDRSEKDGGNENGDIC